MEKFSSESKTARMPVVPVHMPGDGGYIALDAVGDVAFAFDFPVQNTKIYKVGEDLHFQSHEGNSVTLKGYFENFSVDLDFRVQFYADGYAYTSRGFFEAFPFEIAESAPAAGNIFSSGGLSEFAELPDLTVTGVSRLGAMEDTVEDEGSGNKVEPGDTANGFFGGESPLPPSDRDPSHGVEEGGGSAVKPEPEPEPEPEPGSEPKDDRFVMHTGSSDTSINNQSITGNVLANDGDAGAKLVAVVGGAYGSASINAETGEVTYTLNANAAAQMGSGKGQITDTISYTAMGSDGNLYTKTIEIVVVREVNGAGQYISDNAIDGETHGFYAATTGDKISGTPEIVLGDGDDMVNIYKQMLDVEMELGDGDNVLFVSTDANSMERSVINAGDGNNTIHMESAWTPLAYNSHLVLGDGDNNVNLSGAWALYSSSGITAGDGDNFINLDGGAIGFSAADASFIHTGDGNNTITVTGKPGRFGLSYGEIMTGSGNDSIQVSTSEGKTAMSNYSRINAGDGDNTVTVTGTHGMDIYSSITTGDGDDVISISAANGYGMNGNSSINAGDGKNTIHVTGKIAMEKGTITTGNGDDLITVNGWDGYAVGSSTINAGEGNNEVHIQGSREGLYYNSSVIAGDGDDIINIFGNMWGVRENSHVDAGNGNNFVTVGGTEQYGLYYNSSITTGDGNDVITVFGGKRGMSEGAAINAGDGDNEIWVRGGEYAVYGGTISTGSGADTVTIQGSVYNGTVDLGGGNDILRLEAEKSGQVLFGNTMLSGGDNETFDAETGSLGDILSLDHSLSSVLTGAGGLGGITGANVTGFETLHLDLVDGNADTLDIDQLLLSLNTKGFTGDNAFGAIVVTGDSSDSHLFSGDWVSSGQGVILDGFDGVTFDRYTINNGQEILEIYLQTGIA